MLLLVNPVLLGKGKRSFRGWNSGAFVYAGEHENVADGYPRQLLQVRRAVAKPEMRRAQVGIAKRAYAATAGQRRRAGFQHVALSSNASAVRNHFLAVVTSALFFAGLFEVEIAEVIGDVRGKVVGVMRLRGSRRPFHTTAWKPRNRTGAR